MAGIVSENVSCADVTWLVWKIVAENVLFQIWPVFYDKNAKQLREKRSRGSQMVLIWSKSLPGGLLGGLGGLQGATNVILCHFLGPLDCPKWAQNGPGRIWKSLKHQRVL